ncbi:MAG TPA: hypothetical protein VH813_04470 [Candidatus Limnocylindrales bacterium]|jgi:hypothetical protein
MSKRHHVHRRKAYGRRQHELRERVDRRTLDADPGGWDGTLDVLGNPVSFLEPRGGRVRFALGE